jgi:cytochrome c553
MTRTPYLLLIAVLVAACGREQAPSQPPKADASAGKAVAAGKCVSCHGLDGKSNGPDIPHLGGQKQAYLQTALNDYRKGIRHHAALQQMAAELSEADLANVAAYYAAQPAIAPATPAAAPAADRLTAGKSAAAACAACHGEDGNATVKGNPSLAGQHPGYLITALQTYKDGSRKDAVMAAQVAKLDQASMENIALYYASQTPKGRDKSTSGEAATGEPLSGKCGGCHGMQGHSADAITPSLAGQDAAYLVKTMKAYRDGARKHAEMKISLTGAKDKDLEHIAAFYVAQTPQAAKLAGPTSGHAWAERCDKCHGPQTENPAMVAPRIDGQPATYLAKALKDYRDGKRPQSAMHAMGAPLSDADIQALSNYYAAQAPR